MFLILWSISVSEIMINLKISASQNCTLNWLVKKKNFVKNPEMNLGFSQNSNYLTWVRFSLSIKDKLGYIFHLQKVIPQLYSTWRWIMKPNILIILIKKLREGTIDHGPVIYPYAETIIEYNKLSHSLRSSSHNKFLKLFQ